jgi:FkbM family methyltransferase
MPFIDVGCHKGDIAAEMLSATQNGVVYGFEPIPTLFSEIVERFADDGRFKAFQIALSDSVGETSFNYVVSNPGYSGILKRRFDRLEETVELITVRKQRLDETLLDLPRVDLIKIDVEGAELLVLTGATELISKFKPIVVFEFGLGASDHYGVTPRDVFDFFAQYGMSIFLLDSYLNGASALTMQAFDEQYTSGKNFYFFSAAQ